MADFIVLGDEGDDEKYYALVKKNIENKLLHRHLRHLFNQNPVSA